MTEEELMELRRQEALGNVGKMLVSSNESAQQQYQPQSQSVADYQAGQINQPGYNYMGREEYLNNREDPTGIMGWIATALVGKEAAKEYMANDYLNQDRGYDMNYRSANTNDMNATSNNMNAQTNAGNLDLNNRKFAYTQERDPILDQQWNRNMKNNEYIAKGQNTNANANYMNAETNKTKQAHVESQAPIINKQNQQKIDNDLYGLKTDRFEAKTDAGRLTLDQTNANKGKVPTWETDNNGNRFYQDAQGNSFIAKYGDNKIVNQDTGEIMNYNPVAKDIQERNAVLGAERTGEQKAVASERAENNPNVVANASPVAMQNASMAQSLAQAGNANIAPVSQPRPQPQYNVPPMLARQQGQPQANPQQGQPQGQVPQAPQGKVPQGQPQQQAQAQQAIAQAQKETPAAAAEMKKFVNESYYMTEKEKAAKAQKIQETRKLETQLNHDIKDITEVVNVANDLNGIQDVIGFIEGSEWTGGLSDNNMFGSRDSAMRSKLQSFEDEAFMAVRDSLKGAGQITDYEGKRAEGTALKIPWSSNDPKEVQKVMKNFAQERIDFLNVENKRLGRPQYQITEDKANGKLVVTQKAASSIDELKNDSEIGQYFNN